MHFSSFLGSSSVSHWHFWLWVRDTMICACGKLVQSGKWGMYRWLVIKHRAMLCFYCESILNGRRRWIANGWLDPYNRFRGVERRRWMANVWQRIIHSRACSDIVCIGFCICDRCQRIKKQLERLSLCVWLELEDINHIVCLCKQFSPGTCSQSTLELIIDIASELNAPFSGFWERLDGRLICNIRRAHAICARTQAIVCCSQSKEINSRIQAKRVRIRTLKPNCTGDLREGGNKIHWDDGDVWFWTGKDIDSYADRFIDNSYNIPLSRELLYILRHVAGGAWTPIEEVLFFLRNESSLDEVLSVACNDTNRFETLQCRFIRAK